MSSPFLLLKVAILLTLAHVGVVAIECTSPTTVSGNTISLTGCTISTADLVVNVSTLASVVGAASSSSRSVLVSDITLAGHSLIVTGWLATSSVDIARVDTGTLSIDISGIIGIGRIVLAGNFPNATSARITASTVSIDNTFPANGALPSPIYGCSGPRTVSSVLCVSSPSLTYDLEIGPSVSVTNSWDATGYTGGAITTASAVAIAVGDLDNTGSLSFYGLTAFVSVASTGIASSGTAAYVSVASNRILGSVNISHSVLTVNAYRVQARGFAWWASAFYASLFLKKLFAVDHVNISATSTTDEAIGMVLLDSSDVVCYRDSEFTLTSSSITAVSLLDAVGLDMSTVNLTRSSFVSLMNSTWNVTSTSENATAIVLNINAVFPSMLLIYGNTANVSTITDFRQCSFLTLSGTLKTNAQLLVHMNSITLAANTTIIYPPVSSASGEGNNTAIPMPIQPCVVRMDAAANGTLHLMAGSFIISQVYAYFGSATIPLLLDGENPNIIFMYPGGQLKLMGVHLFGGSGTGILDRMQPHIFLTVLRGYEIVMGCVEINDVFPAYILSDYMSADVLDMLSQFVDCNCYNPASAFGSALAISGTYPRCSFTCQRPSSNPITELRGMCAQPVEYTFSSTITTKTPMPMVTATTYTDFLTPTKGTLSLSNSTTPMPTMSIRLSASRSVEPTSTPRLTPSPSLLSTKTHTITQRNSSNTMSPSITALQSKSRSSSLHQTPTAVMTITDTKTKSSMQSTTRTLTLGSSTRQMTRHTIFVSPSYSLTLRPLSVSHSIRITATKYGHSRTTTFIPPPPPFLFLAQSQALGFLTLALTSVSSVLSSNPTVFHTQFIAVLGQVFAASSNAYQRTLPMAYILSPFWNFGPVIVAVANILLIVALFVFHLGATKADLVGKLRPEPESSQPELSEPPATAATSDIPQDWVRHRFPEISYAAALVLYQGVVSAAFNIFYHQSGPAFVIGTICLLFTIALPLGYYFVLYSFLKTMIPNYYRVQYRHAYARFLPDGFWAAGRVTKTFGRLFDSYKGDRIKFGGYMMLVVLLVNAPASVYSANASQRNAQFGLLGLIFLVSALFVGILRPHRSAVTNGVFIASFVMLMMLCVCLANESTNVGAANGVPVLIIILEILLWINGIYDIVIWVSEHRGFIKTARLQLDRGDDTGIMSHRQTVKAEPLMAVEVPPAEPQDEAEEMTGKPDEEEDASFMLMEASAIREQPSTLMPYSPSTEKQPHVSHSKTRIAEDEHEVDNHKVLVSTAITYEFLSPKAPPPHQEQLAPPPKPSALSSQPDVDDDFLSNFVAKAEDDVAAPAKKVVGPPVLLPAFSESIGGRPPSAAFLTRDATGVLASRPGAPPSAAKTKGSAPKAAAKKSTKKRRSSSSSDSSSSSSAAASDDSDL